MAVKFVGIARVDMDGTDKDGKELNIHGYNFWFLEPNTNNQSVGDKPFKKFVGDTAIDSIVGLYGGVQGMKMYVGKDCTVIFNQYGKIADLQFPQTK